MAEQKKNANSRMRQTAGELNYANMEVQNMVDGETYFSVNSYSQHRNIGFYAEQCLEQEMAYATPP